MSQRDLETAHAHCARNRAELQPGGRAGCFYCEQTFDAAEIRDWTDNGVTAPCPRCGIDAVLSASVAPIDRPFLSQMHQHWFERTVPVEEVARVFGQTEHSSTEHSS